MAGLVRLPAELAEQAAAFADGTSEPVEPRDAATVVLMRPGAPTHLDVWGEALEDEDYAALREVIGG